jgi:hypothetical protein
MSVEALVPRVRRSMGVSSSYDAETIPDLVRGAIRRLLRDYNFPKSVSRYYFGSGGTANGAVGSLLALDDQAFALPSGFKREFQLRFYNPTEETWSDALKKREGFIEPAASGETEYYWIEGTQLHIDTKIEEDGVGTQLIMIYQSKDVAANEAWVTEDYEDAVCYRAIMAGAVEVRKPDVAKVFAEMWADERESLAIYLNELEWGNVVMMQRERRLPVLERYPTDGN